MRVLVILAMVLTIGGCSSIGNFFGGAFGGRTSDQALPFKSKLKRGEDRRDFLVTVRAGGASLEDVRESVRFPATRYCIQSYGGSDVDWLINPDTGDWSFARDGQDMVFSGRCTVR